MTVLKIVGANNEDIGMINWFAVHPTSMNNTNKLVSGDHKVRPTLLYGVVLLMTRVHACAPQNKYLT